MQCVHIGLKAQGMGLTRSASSLASGAVERVVFDVELSEEWEGFDYYAVIVQRGDFAQPCGIDGGRAVMDARAVEVPCTVAACVVAWSGIGEGLELMRTEQVYIEFEESGIR